MASRGPTRALLGAFDWLDRRIEAAERAVLAWSVIAMAGLSIANVIGRNLLGRSLAFAEELAQILVILVTFLGIGYGVRHARHIRMSAIYDQLAGGPRKALLTVTHLGTGLLLLVLAWYAGHYVAGTWDAGSVTPALRIPWFAVYVWVPLGLAVGGVQYLLGAVRNLTTSGIHASFQREEAYEDPESVI